LEVALLAIRLLCLALPELEHLVGVAQPRFELGAAIVDRCEPILGARDRRQRIHEHGIGRLAVSLERLETLPRLAHVGLGARERLRARRNGPLDGGELLLDLANHAPVRRALLAQLRELAAARGDQRGERLALAAAVLDLALALLDVAAQCEQGFTALREDALALAELE